MVVQGDSHAAGRCYDRRMKAAVCVLAAALSLSAAGTWAPVAIHTVQPQYTAEAIRHQLEGVVTLYVEIGADGRAHNIRVIHSLGMGLDEEAIAAVSLWR